MMEYTMAADAPARASAGPGAGDRSHTTFSQQSSASPPAPRLVSQQQQQCSSATPPPHPPAKRRRATRADGPNGNGCLNCRARKVKCPGRPTAGGACSSCVKFKFDCNFANGEDGPVKVVRVPPSIHRTEAGTPRTRAPRACNECHAHKTRCTSEHPQCKRCKSMGIECVYEKSKRKSASAASSSRMASTPRAVGPAHRATTLAGGSATEQQQQSFEVQQSIEGYQPASPSVSVSSVTEPHRRMSYGHGHSLLVEDILARKSVVIKHFQMWFKVWARFPLMDFLHAESTYLEIEENRLNQNLGKIVCAITARYIHPGSRELPTFAEMCAQDVKRYVSQHMGSFLKEEGRENLIILLITICHFWMELEMGKVWMLMGLAGRMITALQLNWDGAGETPFEQESIHRAVWAIWQLDRRLAGGFEEHLVLRDEVMHLSRPVHDAQIPMYDTATPGSQQIFTVDPPLCAFHIDLHRMKHHILSVTKNLAISPTPHPRPRLELSKVLESLNQLQNRLFQFHQSLPECFKVSDARSIAKWAASPDCGSFVTLYTIYCELNIDLHRFSIPGLREEADPEIARQLPREFVEQSRYQAVGYAVSLSRFWRSMQKEIEKRPADDGTEKMLTSDTSILISLIQCTKVLLAARKHKLFAYLGEGSSAPLVQQEPVTDESLAALIESNMGHFDAISQFFPRYIEVYTQDLRAAVQNFQGGIPYDNPQQTIGMPARKPPQNVRLPGPHYMLEQAIAPPDEGHRAPQHHRSGLDVISPLTNQTPSDIIVPAGRFPGQEEATISEKADIPVPVWLATARAREAPVSLPSEPAMPQPFPAAPFSPFQHQPGTAAVQIHSPSLPPYQTQQHQHQYGGQYQSTVPAIPQSIPRAPPSSTYMHPQQTTQHQHHAMSGNSRPQIMTPSERSPWRRSPPMQQSSPNIAPANFSSQPSLPVQQQVFHQYPHHQPSVQAMQGQQPSPGIPTYYSSEPQSMAAPSSSYENTVPQDRSSILEHQRLPPDATDNTYWSNQASTSFAMPSPSAGRPPPPEPLVYDRARGASASAVAVAVQLPDPHARSLATQLTTGYYVRAAEV